MQTLDTTHEVLGPWSLAMSIRFWEGFTPAALAPQTGSDGGAGDDDASAPKGQLSGSSLRSLPADEIVRKYGADRSLDEITDAWRPFRSWASVHLRALA